MISKNILLKFLFFFLIFIPVSFAGWQTIAGIAVFASLLILVLVYMLGFGFGFEDMKFLAKEEMYQLIITIVLIGIIGSADLAFNSFSEQVGSLADPGSTVTLQQLSIESVDSALANVDQTLSEIKSFASTVGKMATLSYYCNLLGSGVFLSTCGAYGTFLPSLAVASQILSLALAELGSLNFLLQLGEGYAFNLILPLGIFLRAFKFTRGAGGFFISLGVCLYFILPLSVLFIDSIIQDFSDEYHINSVPDLGLEDNEKCLEKRATYENVQRVQTVLADLISDEVNLNSMDNLEKFTFYFLIQSTLLLAISLMVFLVALQNLTSLFGAEIDVSVLGKLG